MKTPRAGGPFRLSYDNFVCFRGVALYEIRGVEIPAEEMNEKLSKWLKSPEGKAWMKKEKIG